MRAGKQHEGIPMTQMDIIEQGVVAVAGRIGQDFPRTALMLGSGLGDFATHLSDVIAVPYGEIPGFSASTVAGHAGKLLIGKLKTGAGNLPLAILQGRIHAYEGHPQAAIATPVRILRRLGVEQMVLTNAAGGLRPDLPAGSLMAIADHINFSGSNPLVGANDERIGPRFFDMSAAYDPALLAYMQTAAAEAGVALQSGVYLYTVGPNFETPAEVRMFARLGADAVGMSTVPECLAARHCGMKVAGLSLITNLAAGLAAESLSHDQTLSAARAAYASVERLLLKFFTKLI